MKTRNFHVNCGILLGYPDFLLFQIFSSVLRSLVLFLAEPAMY